MQKGQTHLDEFFDIRYRPGTNNGFPGFTWEMIPNVEPIGYPFSQLNSNLFWGLTPGMYMYFCLPQWVKHMMRFTTSVDQMIVSKTGVGTKTFVQGDWAFLQPCTDEDQVLLCALLLDINLWSTEQPEEREEVRVLGLYIKEQLIANGHAVFEWHRRNIRTGLEAHRRRERAQWRLKNEQRKVDIP